MPELEHESGTECWCVPYLDYTTENGSEVWVHRSDEHPPPEIMAEAIVAASESEGDTAK